MSFIPNPTLDDAMAYGYEHRLIVAMAEAAREYDERTGTDQLIRDSEQLQIFIRRRDMFRDALVGALTPNDRAAYAEQVERIDALIEREQQRLGLSE